MQKLFFAFSIILLISFANANISDICNKDEDCLENNYCFQGRCHHKSLLPLDGRDVFGFLSIIVGAALSNAGGIGGGGLFIPILIFILEFYTHEAIPISKLIIFSGALTALVLNLKLKHPTRSTLGIDYNIALMIVPMLLFGTTVGVTLNKVTPSVMILVLMTLVLTINTYKTTKKAINLFKLESEEKLIKETEMKGLSLSDNDKSNIELKMEKSDMTEENKKKNMDKQLVEYELQREKRFFQWNKLKFIVASYVIMVILTLVRGSDYLKSIVDIEKCSSMYWIVYFLYLPIGVVITYYAGKLILEEKKYRLGIGFPYDTCDLIWNSNLLIKFPIYGFLCGTAAGLVGIGGGLILGPLLIGLGIHPIIATVTSNFLVLFTSSSTTLQFSLAGMMNFSYGGVCTIFSVVGSFIGTIGIHYILIVFKRESILVIVVCAALILSTIFLPIYSFVQTLEDYNSGNNIWDFNTSC